MKAVEPKWLGVSAVKQINADLVHTHGGLGPAIRDENLLHSSLARAQNLFAYGTPDLFDLAAAYCFGIAKNHPFVDGNKRTAFTCAMTFLEINGHSVVIDEAMVVAAMEQLAANDMSDEGMAHLLRDHA